MNDIELEHVTKDYGSGRGIFDVSFALGKGEMLGYVGTNGSGKTTTIRHIMGFSKPDNGTILVRGLDAYRQAPQAKKLIGYVPGEIAFPDLASGQAVVQSQAELLGLKDMSFANELIRRLQLDITANPRRMSKGMKQKLAVVIALMNDPAILILDEPTTGLDPLMRMVFTDIISEQKKAGKTIMMSSQLFEELQQQADKVALIVDGRLVDVVELEPIRQRKEKDYKLSFKTPADYQRFEQAGYVIIRRQPEYSQLTVRIQDGQTSQLLKELTGYQLAYMTEIKYDLEKVFKDRLKTTKECEK